MNQGCDSGKEQTILLADDDAAMRSLVSDELCENGYGVVGVADGHGALDFVRRKPPALIITDLRMPHGGLDLIGRLKIIAPQTPIILLTAFGDATTEANAHERGVSAFFNKPVRMAELKTAIERLLKEATTEKQGGTV